MLKVLLVEDDPALARGLQVNLELEGYLVSHAATLSSAYQYLENNKKNSEHHKNFELVVLDLNLPDGHGFDLLKKIRNELKLVTPVIILTAQTHEDSVVEGLNLGANDYVRKPFGNKELFARIKTVLRKPLAQTEQMSYGDVVIFLDERVVRLKDQIIEMNRREFDILVYLMERAEKVVTRESLIQGLNKDLEIFDRTIDSHISHLRGRLKQNGALKIKISSVYGVGYRLEKVYED